MRRAAVIVPLVAAFLASPVAATESRRGDKNDTPGRLDIKQIAHGHGGGGLWHRVVMHERWGPRHLRGGDSIEFFFSTDREDRYDEVHAMVGLKDGKLRAWIFPYVEGSGHVGVGPSERIRFVRPDGRSIKIFFDREWVDKRNRYVWSVGSSYRKSGSRRCRELCFDYAPGTSPDRLAHNL